MKQANFLEGKIWEDIYTLRVTTISKYMDVSGFLVGFVFTEITGVMVVLDSFFCNMSEARCYSNFYIWGFPKMVVPQNGWFIMENPL